MIERAGRRTEWASRALDAAAGELREAAEQGALVNGAAERVQGEALRVVELVQSIEADREASTSERRVFDWL